ncbi:MAG: hypothetical protein ACI358_03960 [Candidatus Limimorpha sp.]
MAKCSDNGSIVVPFPDTYYGGETSNNLENKDGVALLDGMVSEPVFLNDRAVALNCAMPFKKNKA